MSNLDDEDEAPAPRKGRGNAILTYETVEAIQLGIQKALLGIAHLTKQVDTTHMDHEARLRVLEANQQGGKGSTSAAKFIFSAMWPIAGIVMAVLSYLK